MMMGTARHKKPTQRNFLFSCVKAPMMPLPVFLPMAISSINKVMPTVAARMM